VTSTKPELRPTPTSKPGAIEISAVEAERASVGGLPGLGRVPRRVAPISEPRPAEQVTDDFFIPDFCSTRMVFVVVLISELLSVTLTLARPSPSFFLELARVSLFVLWLALTSATVLCYSRPLLVRLGVARATGAVLLLLLANTALISGAALWFGNTTSLPIFPRDAWPFILRNQGICLIAATILLRYLFVAHEWRRQTRAEARSRIEALQARIRPHFLFNSLNTIASLTRSNPTRAEEAVEDLADLFRATLRESHDRLRLADELELTRVYQRIEQDRLGERLHVVWDVAELPMRALLPGLTIQPLLENAIYHGIEPLDRGGTVTVSGRVKGRQLEITVANPVAPEGAADRTGNRLALDNIRQRLRLAYAEQGALEIDKPPGMYRVTIRFPHEE
jgi:two-component system, LytTR family, sensor histidine kinase AlgZ